MIDVREAAERSLSFLAELMNDSELKGPLKGVSLEEIELSEDGKTWATTFSYPAPEPEYSILGKASESILRGIPKRRYKVVRIDAEDGRFLSMKTA